MNINKKVTLQRIQTLTELHGAPGFEEEVKNYMTQQMAPVPQMNLLKIVWVDFLV